MKKTHKQDLFIYWLVRVPAWFVSRLFFRRKLLRNELKGKKGPAVVIANHQASLDFVNLMGTTWRPMTFVVSRSMYASSPVRRWMDKIGVIPKQQFQTTLRDMRRMKAVIDEGKILVVYPAGLMCEDGCSTPTPAPTYRFLQWLGADVYVARSTGTYFVMPKWTSGFRAGRTTLDIYRLFSAEELAAADLESVRARTDAALSFDAYREQETLRSRHKNAACLEGLQNVLYQCPHCGGEFTVQVRDRSELYCTACGFAHRADEYGFLHNTGTTAEEFRYVSDWSRHIYDRLADAVAQGKAGELSAPTRIQTIDKKGRFQDVGQGTLTLREGAFTLEGTLNDAPLALVVPTLDFASLPFKPGKYLELQLGEDIYRCVLEDGRLAMKFINLVKIYYARGAALRR